MRSAKVGRSNKNPTFRLHYPRPINLDASTFVASRLPRHIAMSKARVAHPDLFVKHQAEAAAIIEKCAPRAVEKSAAVIGFEAKVDTIQIREGCSHLVALRKAARQFPVEREGQAVFRGKS
jgi:hypothetical protein